MDSNKNHVIWLMGPTSSGKTTIGSRLKSKLRELRVPVIHFDGDEVRDFFGDKIGFSKKDRLMVVKTIVHLANKSLSSGLNVVVSALTANQDARALVENTVENLIKVYIKCDIQTCIDRDPKGLYRAAQKGEINTMIGFNCEYTPPEQPDFTIDTESKSVEACVAELVSFLENK